MSTQPNKQMDSFENPHPGRPYEVVFHCPEFTCICPKTGQPDFADFFIRYIPAKRCVELKSLKLYLWSFRQEGHFHEDVTNIICNDLKTLMNPQFLEVKGVFKVRGGITTTVIAREGKEPKSP